MSTKPTILLRAALIAVLLVMTVAACGPNQAAAKPLSPAQKIHLAVAEVKQLSPLQTAASFCMRGILGAAKDESIQKALENLFAQQTGKNTVGGVFTGFEVSGDMVKISDDLGGGQVVNAEFDLGRVIYAVFAAASGNKIFGLIGQPAIDCSEAAWWLDGTVGDQIGKLLRAKLNPPASLAADLPGRPSAIAGDYTLNRRLASCQNFSCILNPMIVHIVCSDVSCTIIRTNNGGGPPWDHSLPLTFTGSAWRAKGSEIYAVQACQGQYLPADVSFTLNVVSGTVIDGVWKAQKLTGTYTVNQSPTPCNSQATTAVENLSGGPS